MNKKISVGLAVSIAALAALIAVVLTYTFSMNTFNSRMSAVIERREMYEDLSELDSRARLSMLYPIDEAKLLTSMLTGYADGLGDADAEYMTADAYEKYKKQADGTAYGLGIDIARNTDGNIIVNRVHENSPAEMKGVKKGDIITYVGDKKVTELGFDEAVKKITSGGAKVTFTVKRKKNEYKFNITKDSYSIASVEYRIVSEDMGYIRITEFNGTTPKQFAPALRSMKNQQVTGITIDLRNNTGGSFEAACEILDTLLPAGNLMITVNAAGEETVVSSDTSDFKANFYILINENTKGAAEMFAGTMGDFKKGKLIGVATAGKNTVQEVFALSSGAAVKLTTGRWKTAQGKYIKNKKVVPEYEIKLTDYQDANLFIMTDAEDPHIQMAIELFENSRTVVEPEPDEPDEPVEPDEPEITESDVSATETGSNSDR